ncbi:asb048 [Agrotis segetum nucleopolyhedrovirus B]|uniref:Asb048 n=1 Tax=Agrotis segetum nucleopolyhedrovirus B TaxID=1580580 RepID=A0A0A7KTC3_9ABAC|nr:asb048 [Agrotis segetum nucleopolyhedrovirus B]AIZ48606.1 asb048 [Agrotis segetum nucleopolyhedrovirus B]
MKLITFVMVIFNRAADLSQQQIYETFLKHFDVIDAIMCNNGDCLAVCISAADTLDRPVAFAEFQCAKKHLMQIVDRHENVEVLLERMYNIVEMYNDQLQNDQ